MPHEISSHIRSWSAEKLSKELETATPNCIAWNGVKWLKFQDDPNLVQLNQVILHLYNLSKSEGSSTAVDKICCSLESFFSRFNEIKKEIDKKNAKKICGCFPRALRSLEFCYGAITPPAEYWLDLIAHSKLKKD